MRGETRAAKEPRLPLHGRTILVSVYNAGFPRHAGASLEEPYEGWDNAGKDRSGENEKAQDDLGL